MFNQLIKISKYALAYFSCVQKISKITETSTTKVKEVYNELFISDFFSSITQKTGLHRSFFDLNMLNFTRAPTLYVVCRLLRPEIVIETGVANGFSSSFILQAITLNKKGRLFSIDLPNQPGQEIKNKVGWIIPENLKLQWNLIFGDSKKELIPLLEKLKSIDVFYHDGDHSYENMLFEYKLAWNFLKNDGFLLSDDITDNNAFSEFSERVKGIGTELFKLGILRKN